MPLLAVTATRVESMAAFIAFPASFASDTVPSTDALVRALLELVMAEVPVLVLLYMLVEGFLLKMFID